jgi:hypothetical protein
VLRFEEHLKVKANREALFQLFTNKHFEILTSNLKGCSKPEDNKHWGYNRIIIKLLFTNVNLKI